MTCAPIFRARSGVPSVELLSTTMTSVTRLEGRSASTRPMACASLWVGMMTDTRTQILSSPPIGLGPPPCQHPVTSPTTPPPPPHHPHRTHPHNHPSPTPSLTPT